MTRKEYNEYRYIKSYETKGFPLTYGTTLTIPTDASPDYKHRLDALYSGWGFHPGNIKTDPRMYDDRERIIYIFGRNETYTDSYGRPYSWEALYTEEEKARFAAALN